MRAKLSIKQVDNGFIVSVISTGGNPMTETIQKPIKVFTSVEDLLTYLAQCFTQQECEVSIEVPTTSNEPNRITALSEKETENERKPRKSTPVPPDN